jgi:hypothetical protein
VAATSDHVTDRLVLDITEPVAPQTRPGRPLGRRVAVGGVVAGIVALVAVQGHHHRAAPRSQAPQPARVDTAVVLPPGPTVSVLGYRFTMPAGMHVVRRHGLALEHRSWRTAVTGRVAYADARGNHSGLDVTVFEGAVARREAAARDPAPMRVNTTTIAGHPATVDAFGAGPAGPSSVEIRVRVSRDVLVLVDSDSVASNVLVDMLDSALTS